MFSRFSTSRTGGASLVGPFFCCSIFCLEIYLFLKNNSHSFAAPAATASAFAVLCRERGRLQGHFPESVRLVLVYFNIFLCACFSGASVRGL